MKSAAPGLVSAPRLGIVNGTQSERREEVASRHEYEVLVEFSGELRLTVSADHKRQAEASAKEEVVRLFQALTQWADVLEWEIIEVECLD